MIPDTDTRAVSPVVGVALMIAITVTLAATVGVFATSVGDQLPADRPTANFAFEFHDTPQGDRDELVVVHEGGDSVDPMQLRLVVSGAEAYDGPGESGTCSVATRDSNRWSAHGMGTTGDVSAGDTATVTNGLFETAAGTTLPADACDSDGADDVVELDGATVRVVWHSSTGDQTFVLGRWSGPAA
jgi:flagellin-like protein